MCVVLCLSFLVCWLLVWVTLAVGCGYSLLISPSTCPFCVSWEGFLICQHVANVLCWPRVNVLLGLPISIHHVKKNNTSCCAGFECISLKVVLLFGGGAFHWFFTFVRCLHSADVMHFPSCLYEFWLHASKLWGFMIAFVVFVVFVAFSQRENPIIHVHNIHHVVPRAQPAPS